jgi:excinuclease ABC subunit C
MIPSTVNIQDRRLPDSPGVYFYYDVDGNLMYVGKATSLRRRVTSYFRAAGDGRGARIAELVSKIARIAYVETPTVIEALVLEANQIKAHKPPYNVLSRDDKSFQYLAVTNEPFPRPLVVRQLDLEREGVNPFDARLSEAARRKYLAVFGPYTSGLSLKRALALVRPSIPWSACVPGQKRPCFDRQLGKCPGVCVGAVSRGDYRKTVRDLLLFFQGRKPLIVRSLKREMARAADRLEFERAAALRGRVFALEHIRDVSLITKEDAELPFSRERADDYLNLNGRIEAYDISNISGTSSVGSMVVFEDGKPAKDQYRKFRIKTVRGANDFASMEEVLRRRLNRTAWPLPVLMVIDGGEGQVAVARRVLEEVFSHPLQPTPHSLLPKLVGIAKGFDRKQDRLVYDRSDAELGRAVARGKEIFQRARDEAHRFAVSYHRTLRSKRSLYAK